MPAMANQNEWVFYGNGKLYNISSRSEVRCDCSCSADINNFRNSWQTCAICRWLTTLWLLTGNQIYSLHQFRSLALIGHTKRSIVCVCVRAYHIDTVSLLIDLHVSNSLDGSVIGFNPHQNCSINNRHRQLEMIIATSFMIRAYYYMNFGISAWLVSSFRNKAIIARE